MNATIFGQADWNDTGLCLMLRIMAKKGRQGGYYMVKNLRSANANIREDDAILWENLETDPFTFARVKNNLNLLKQLPVKGNLISERPLLELEKLSVSKVEVVQTAEKGDWCEGHPPVGLYRDLESD